jgi:hypothetical protein
MVRLKKDSVVNIQEFFLEFTKRFHIFPEYTILIIIFPDSSISYTFY